MLYILLFSLAGILLGAIAGILPGIHPNQVYVALIGFLPLLSSYPSEAILSLILCTALMDTMGNYIPSLFFSLPDSKTVINVLPGHRMVLEGKGLDALFISLTGAFVTLIVCVLSLPLLLFIIPIIHEFLYPYLHFLLIGLAGWMVIMERSWKKRFLSLLLYVLSGIWGLLTLNSMLISSEWVLFPTLTGMFGIAGLLMSMQEVRKIPSQTINEDVNVGSLKKVVVSGLVAGLLIGVLPGAGESQAGVLVSEFTGLNQKEFLGALAGINMANMFFALVSLYSFSKIRSGAAAAIDQIIFDFGINHLLFSIGIILLSGALSVLLTWYMGKKMLKKLEKINYKRASQIILLFTMGMIFWFTGFIGIFIMVISTCLGLLSVLWGVKRTSNMGFLMVSTTIYFAGLTHVINSFVF